MKKQSTLFLAVFLSLAGMAQQDSTNLKFNWPSKTPKYNIRLATQEGYKVEGLLAAKTDSSLFIFPGHSKAYKNRTDYSAAFFIDQQIETIHIKRRNAVGRGALIGLGVGLLPVVAALFAGKDKQAFGFAAVVTVPLGPIVGALIGAASGRTFHIGGQRKAFKHFSSKVKL